MRGVKMHSSSFSDTKQKHCDLHFNTEVKKKKLKTGKMQLQPVSACVWQLSPRVTKTQTEGYCFVGNPTAASKKKYLLMGFIGKDSRGKKSCFSVVWEQKGPSLASHVESKTHWVIGDAEKTNKVNNWKRDLKEKKHLALQASSMTISKVVR